MRVITRDRAKTLLGLTDATYDTELDLQIPILDAAVKQITGDRLNMQLILSTTNAVQYAEIFSLFKDAVHIWDRREGQYDNLWEYLQVGQRIEGEGIPSDTYIEDVYYNGSSVTFSGEDYAVPAVKLSNAATATSTNAQVFVGMSIAYDVILAKGLWYLVGQINTTVKAEDWVSKSMGPVSVTRSEMQASAQGRGGMPSWFVTSLPRNMSGYT